MFALSFKCNVVAKTILQEKNVRIEIVLLSELELSPNHRLHLISVFQCIIILLYKCHTKISQGLQNGQHYAHHLLPGLFRASNVLCVLVFPTL